MRTTPSGVYTSVTAAAALLVLLLLGATGPAPSSSDSSWSGFTSENFKETYRTPSRYANITGSNTVWVTPSTGPALMVNASYDNVLSRGLNDCTVGSVGYIIWSPGIQASNAGELTTNPDGSTTATTIDSCATSSDTTAAQTSKTTSYHDTFGEGSYGDPDNESRWRRFRHEPLRLPDHFMAGFLNTLVYLAEVITADGIFAFLFGRWRPRYYQRARRNRLNGRRRRRFRLLMVDTGDVVMMVWATCIQVHHTLRVGQDDASGPTYQMISNLQLTEYPATLSTFVDVRTSEVIAAMTLTRRSALGSIVFTSAPTSGLPGLSLLASRGPPAGATNVDLPPIGSTDHLLLPEVAEKPAVASCHPRVTLPNTGLEIALRPAVSPRVSLLLAPASPTTGPSISTSQCPPAAADEVTTLCVEKPLTAMCSSAVATTNGCEAGTANTLMRYNTADNSVPTPVEEFGDGQADTADEAPPPPFFVCEHYTPESTCFVSARGVAYTTTIMSYTHQFNHPTRGDPQDDTPILTQEGDVSDVLWPAANPRMRCKWYKACIHTTSSEFYRSSVKAVFASRLVLDDADMAVLNDLVKELL